jgi:hypothetical protein
MQEYFKNYLSVHEKYLHASNELIKINKRGEIPIN